MTHFSRGIDKIQLNCFNKLLALIFKVSASIPHNRGRQPLDIFGNDRDILAVFAQKPDGPAVERGRACLEGVFLKVQFFQGKIKNEAPSLIQNVQKAFDTADQKLRDRRRRLGKCMRGQIGDRGVDLMADPGNDRPRRGRDRPADGLTVESA